MWFKTRNIEYSIFVTLCLGLFIFSLLRSKYISCISFEFRKADNLVYRYFTCAVFSLGPRTSDLEYEIMDLCGVNLFAPLPLSISVLPGT